MAGIREVAKKAGVAISTVSYALNGSDKISEDTRQRVLAVAEEIGYRPKLAARTLKGSKTNIIGVYVAGFQGEFYGELLDGMQQSLEQLGYDMVVTSGSRARNFLPEELFDGAIVLDSNFSDELLFKYLDAGSKVVVMDRKINHKNARSVLLDNENGSVQAVNYLLTQNLQHYYIISGPENNYDVESRLTAALQTFDAQGVEVKVFPGDFTEQSGMAFACELLARQQDQVGIYTLNDNEAVGFYRTMFAHQREIAGHYKLVGFDNNHATELFSPVLPSISYHKHYWGETAATTLVKLIENKAEVKNRQIRTEINFRKQQT